MKLLLYNQPVAPGYASIDKEQGTFKVLAIEMLMCTRRREIVGRDRKRRRPEHRRKSR